MTTLQLIKNSLREVEEITRTKLELFDNMGKLLYSGGTPREGCEEEAKRVAASGASTQTIGNRHYFVVSDDDRDMYILSLRNEGEVSHMVGAMTAIQVKSVAAAARERADKGTFIQNIILDNLLSVDIYRQARKYRIEDNVRRLVYIVELLSDTDGTAMEIMKGLFSSASGDYLTQIDEKSIILVKEMGRNEGYEAAAETALMIYDTVSAEAMSGVIISYGTIVETLAQISASYKEAAMAMEVGRIFYSEKSVHAYDRLGIGRLIYQLPPGLCGMFMREVFTKEGPETFDEETINTINRFFENSLNVSETARQMYLHRNTLVYRLDKLYRSTGLDIRRFDDALTLKIAMMVARYMDHLDGLRG